MERVPVHHAGGIRHRVRAQVACVCTEHNPPCLAARSPPHSSLNREPDAHTHANSLGAVPFWFLGRLSAQWEGIANAIACGVMLAASFDLIHEVRSTRLLTRAPTHELMPCVVSARQGHQYSSSSVVMGVLAGTLFIRTAHARLQASGEIEFAHLRGGGARKTLLMLAIMTAHAFGEGAGMGVAFAGRTGWTEGIAVNAAIGVHNVPEGLAVATVLVTAGTPPGVAALWAIVTHLPQALVAVPAFLFVEAFQQLLPGALGFAAGCMLWMVFAELLPDATQALPPDKVATAATLAAATLEGLRCALAYVASGGYTWRDGVGGTVEPGPGLMAHVPRRYYSHAGSAVALPWLATGVQLAAVTVGATPLGAVCVLRSTMPTTSAGCPIWGTVSPRVWSASMGGAVGMGVAMVASRWEAISTQGAAPAALAAALAGAVVALVLHLRGRPPGAASSSTGLPLYSPASGHGEPGGALVKGTLALVAALAASSAASGLAVGTAARIAVNAQDSDDVASQAPLHLALLLIRTAAAAGLRGALLCGVTACGGARFGQDVIVSVATTTGIVQLGALMLTLLAPPGARVLDGRTDTVAHTVGAAMLLTSASLQAAAWRSSKTKQRHVTAALLGGIACFLAVLACDVEAVLG